MWNDRLSFEFLYSLSGMTLWWMVMLIDEVMWLFLWDEGWTLWDRVRSFFILLSSSTDILCQAPFAAFLALFVLEFDEGWDQVSVVLVLVVCCRFSEALSLHWMGEK